MATDEAALQAIVTERAGNLGMAYARGLLERGITPNVKLAFGCACQAWDTYYTSGATPYLARRGTQGIFLEAFIDAVRAVVREQLQEGKS